jgi:hypothetical protein
MTDKPVQLDPRTPCGLCGHTAQEHADEPGNVLACKHSDCVCEAWCECLVLSEKALRMMGTAPRRGER